MNAWTGSGRIRAAPRLTYTQAGVARAGFSLEVERPGSRGATDFINVVTWGADAEDVRDFGNPGEFVEIQGFLQARTYRAEDGERRIYEIVAQKISFPLRKMMEIERKGENS